jgi:PAS domain-containing protein
MKVLYVSPEQSDPLRQALGTAGADVVFSSATQLGDAAHWIFSNLDVAALILDAEFGQPQCATFLKNLRSRGLSVPLLLMAPESNGWREDLKLTADDCIVPKESLLSDVDGFVRRVVYRARPSAAFTVLAGHVVDIHRQLDRTDREHDLRIEVGDLRAAQAALQEACAAERARFAERIAEHRAACTTLQQELDSKTATVERLGQRERELQTALADATNARDALASQLAASQSSLRAAEQQSREQRVATLKAETQRDAQQRAFASTQSGLDRTIAELEGALDTAARELVSTRAERDGLRAHADLAQKLQRQLDDMVQRVDHEFDNSPLPLCRATRAGVITHANRAFGALLGCPSAGAKRRLTLASELFESSKELAWLIERSVSSEEPPSVECTRRKVDESRLMLRLRATAAPDAINIVVEDLTSNWILQEKLNRAQQMEAVGRMAAEVALTCVSFLQDATNHGRRLIAMLEDRGEARRSSEQMIGEVDRVAASLRQLARYADDQVTNLEPVDLHQVLRDLEPILQELAGDDVQVVLPEEPAQEVPFNVDLPTQRVERLLINLARYSRGRIASGGRMVFEIASTTVDGQFVAKFPNVRRGAHVLLTVTQDGAHEQESTAGGNGSGPSVSGTTGGDLSALHGLVRHCGGHLWMDTETTGETKIKIHLPLRAA